VELALGRSYCYGRGECRCGVHGGCGRCSVDRVWSWGGVDLWCWGSVSDHRSYGWFVVSGYAGVGSSDRNGCWGGGQVVRGWGGQVVDDWRWWSGEFGVLDGDDVSGGGGVTGNQ